MAQTKSHFLIFSLRHTIKVFGNFPQKNLPLYPTKALPESGVTRQSHTGTHGFIAALFNALHLLTKRRGVANENLIKMSVVIRAYANHGLQINSYWNSIGQIERKLKSKIEVGKRSDYDITDDEDNIVYFANHDYFSKRFEEGWGIYVFSNFRLCEEIRIYKHFAFFDIGFNFNIKTHLWRDLICGATLKEHKYAEKEILKSLSSWNKTRNFIKLITNKLGGDQIIYINDGSELTIGEDLIWEGRDVEAVLWELSKVSNAVNYSDLASGKYEYLNNNWFMEGTSETKT